MWGRATWEWRLPPPGCGLQFDAIDHFIHQYPTFQVTATAAAGRFTSCVFSICGRAPVL